jgi:hypothetical protein
MADESDNWRATKHHLKQRWPGLADDELEASHGERSALLALLEGRLGYARTNAEQDLDQVLSGETVIPADVADESTHTGTSGPVGPVSAATDFSRSGAKGGTSAAQNLGSPTSEQGGASTTGGRSDLSDYSREPWENGVPTTSDTAQRTPPWQRSRGRARMIEAVSVLATAATLLMVGILLRAKRQHTQTRTEEVLERARELSAKVSERAPAIDELRDTLQPLADARMKMSPTTLGIIGAGVTLLAAVSFARRRAQRTQAQQVVQQAHQLSREISQLMARLDALRTKLSVLDDDARGKRKSSARKSGRGRSDK